MYRQCYASVVIKILFFKCCLNLVKDIVELIFLALKRCSSSIYSSYLSDLNIIIIVIVKVFSPGRCLVGFPQENLKWRIKSQEDAPDGAQRHSMSQKDLRTSTAK